MRLVQTNAELDDILREISAAPSDDARRALFQTFSMLPPRDLPSDPFSPDYAERQMALYRQVSGRAYSLDNEATPLDVAEAVRCPFPYHTRSAATVGHHYMAMGFLLRIMALPPRSRVLEFGPGWGNTTVALARMGHQVTAVDVEPRFTEVIRQRGEREAGAAIEAVNADFFWAETCGREFDAVLFFECFHHAHDHLRLLRALQTVLAPGGRIFLGAEPIQPDFPLPWGLRLDGQSLWAIREHGWLELGFRDDYFAEALRRTGWFGHRHVSRDLPEINVWEITRATEPVFSAPGADGRIGTQSGERRDGRLVFHDAPAGAAVYGPYVTLPAGRYRAQLVLAAGERRGRVRMDVAGGQDHHSLAERALDLWQLPAGEAMLELPFYLGAATELVEVRLFNEPGLTAALERVVLLGD
ncbi:class I SAM-dependent methyltransferase [Roseomonas elaeocarpi]|uniref:Class I SAM-dependent methyltransferase n=1 Tax=Roseomonas elaeocarpi TaxID=907779 RepID=A0ABV6JYK6_9PROT